MATTKIIKKVSKSGKVSYQYFVDDKKVRTSARLYVASTANGEFFWSRPDLICKGYYSTCMVKVHHSEKATLATVQQQADKDILECENDIKHYSSKQHLDWLTNLYTRYKNHAAEEAAKDQQEQIKRLNKRLADLRFAATPEQVQKTLHDEWAWAERRRKSLEVVFYDISTVK